MSMKMIAPALATCAALLAGPRIADAQDAASVVEEKPSFDVLEYRVLGNKLLTARQIEAAVYPHLGPGRNIDAVEEARRALEAVYRDNGYGTVFVDIPEQDVDSGIVRLRVTEGRLDRVRITGARYVANKRIRNALPALATGDVPNLPVLQDQLAKVNRQSRDRSVTPVLRAGRTPGTVDVELKVDDHLPLHGNVELTDRYTADTSRTRLSVNLSYDNLFQRLHSLSLQYQTAPEEPSESQVIAATYVAPVGSRGNLFALYAVDTDSEVATIGTLSVLGKGRIYGARYILPLPDQPGLFQSISLGADFKDFDENVRLDPETGLATPVQYLNWSALYSGTLRSDRATTTFGGGISLGMRGFGNDAIEFEDKRLKARPNYWYLQANASHERALPWGTSLLARLNLQYSIEPLISNEQIAIGGASTVRGYLESEELGDMGFSSSLELRSPSLARFLGEHVRSLYFFTFFDAGLVDVLHPLPQQGRRDLSSWGAGLRFTGFGGLETGLDWAYPLVPTDRIATGDSRIHAFLRYGF
jgi:hemolysin activation/secretion protein